MIPNSASTQWEAFLSSYKDAHLLQSNAWGDLKSAFGWDVEQIQSGESGAQILFRRFPLGTSLAYIPKGPLGPWTTDLLPTLDETCKKRRAFVLKIEPDEEDHPEKVQKLMDLGFISSQHTIQPRTTLIVDLTGDEEALLSKMHQKTRYNVRLSMRKGVRVRPWQDLDAFGQMVLETADRDAFGTHTPSYYSLAYELFHPQGVCELLMAEYEGTPLAAVMVFAHGSRAWYFYGASTNLERNRMPSYLLQWEAMKWARQKGCTLYDLWGVPDEDLDTLESEFTVRKSGLWGVYRFKRGFGGNLSRSIGAWDKTYIPIIYNLYRLLTSLMRK